MPDRDTVMHEIVSLTLECRAALDECRQELAAVTSSMGRLVAMTGEADARLARLEGDAASIRQQLDRMPDDALPGRRP